MSLHKRSGERFLPHLSMGRYRRRIAPCAFGSKPLGQRV
jgi:hypothetical protein